jgi:hypothetical protein
MDHAHCEHRLHFLKSATMLLVMLCGKNLAASLSFSHNLDTVTSVWGGCKLVRPWHVHTPERSQGHRKLHTRLWMGTKSLQNCSSMTTPEEALLGTCNGHGIQTTVAEKGRVQRRTGCESASWHYAALQRGWRQGPHPDSQRAWSTVGPCRWLLYTRGG